VTAVEVPVRVSPDTRPVGGAVTGLAVRQVRWGSLVVIGAVAGMSAIVVGTYRSTVRDALDARALAALAENPAIRTLFGEPVALDDAGGFTVWRTGTFVAVLVAVWGALAATRITRGEEDAGRWDLVLAGRVPLRAMVGRHVAVLLAVMVAVGVAVTAAMAGAGTSLSGALIHGAGIGVIGVFSVAAATLAAQVFPTRAAASGATIGLLGFGLLARMVGDGVDALGRLRWLSPFGLLALSRPYDTNRGLPLAVLATAAVVLVVVALRVAGRRDVRGGLLAVSSGRAPHPALLGSVGAFAVRRLIRPLIGWSLGIGAYFLLIGLLPVSMTDFLAANPRFAEIAAQAGFAGLSRVEGYAASLFALLAIPVGAFAAVRIGTFAAAEADRRLTLLAGQPLTRRRLAGAETVATLGGAAVLTTVAGVATWAGTVVVGADLPLGAALAGVWNTLPVALLCLGAAVAALGWLPRWTGAIGVLPGAGGFLLHVTANSAGLPAWVDNLSPFAHLATVPQAGVNWPATAVMTGVAGLLVLAGLIGYDRRDLRG
jgi:ABC-2 type transport system permease protein